LNYTRPSLWLQSRGLLGRLGRGKANGTWPIGDDSAVTQQYIDFAHFFATARVTLASIRVNTNPQSGGHFLLDCPTTANSILGCISLIKR
jgi:hypothetical protein